MMIKEKNLTNAEKKRIESLDKRIEKSRIKSLSTAKSMMP